MIQSLVDRFGRTGFAALTSLMWALPMAAWAGSADLSPIDKTAYPWIALAIGVVMLAVWLVILTRLGRVPVSNRPHRLDFRLMTGSEKRWGLAFAVFLVGLIAWLNGAATVDWAPLVSAISSGKFGPIVFAIFLGCFLVVMILGMLITWRRAGAAFAARQKSAGRQAPSHAE
jgi:hypothetical protein